MVTATALYVFYTLLSSGPQASPYKGQRAAGCRTCCFHSCRLLLARCPGSNSGN